jgi:hypothetical protein
MSPRKRQAELNAIEAIAILASVNALAVATLGRTAGPFTTCSAAGRPSPGPPILTRSRDRRMLACVVPDSPDIRRTLTCGSGFCRTGWTCGIDLRIRRSASGTILESYLRLEACSCNKTRSGTS